jgi:hypothetical protein
MVDVTLIPANRVELLDHIGRHGKHTRGSLDKADFEFGLLPDMDIGCGWYK